MNIIRISDYKTYGCPSCNNKNNNVFLDKYDNNIHIICPKCGTKLNLYSDYALLEILNNNLVKAIDEIESLAIKSEYLIFLKQLLLIVTNAKSFQEIINFLEISKNNIDNLIEGHLITYSNYSKIEISKIIVNDLDLTIELNKDNYLLLLKMLNKISYNYLNQNLQLAFSYSFNQDVITIFFNDEEKCLLLNKLIMENNNILTEEILMMVNDNLKRERIK